MIMSSAALVVSVVVINKFSKEINTVPKWLRIFAQEGALCCLVKKGGTIENKNIEECEDGHCNNGTTKSKQVEKTLYEGMEICVYEAGHVFVLYIHRCKHFSVYCDFHRNWYDFIK